MDTTPTGVSQQPIAPAPKSGGTFIPDMGTSPGPEAFQSIWDNENALARGETVKAPEKAPEPEVEAKAEEEQPEAKAEEAEAPGAEEPEYQGLEDFLAKNKLDKDAFFKLSAPVKVDGESKLVPLVDVLKSYQLEGHVNNKSIELSKAREKWEAERTAAKQQYDQHLSNAMNMGKLAYAQLTQEFSAINWEQLKATDPISWAIKSQEFQARNGQIQAHLQQVSQAQEAESQRVQQERAAALPKEKEKLLEARPEWRDETKFKEARESLRSAANKLGFKDFEIDGITDHRLVLVLDLAAQQMANQKAVPEIVKKVRAAPVMAKPGSRTQRDPKAEAYRSAKARLEKNPTDMDAQLAVFSQYD